MLRYLLLLLAFPASSLAQTEGSQHPFQVGAKWHRGFIIAHSRELIDVSHSNPYGFEINTHWLLAGEKEVRETGLIAKRGFAAYYFNFDNPAVLGTASPLFRYVEPLIRPWGRLYGSVQLGLGAAYVSKVYDEKSNPTNLFFSLPVSFWAMLNANVYFKVKTWQATSSFNYNHISNGGMKSPNKGMNFPTFNLGLQYAFNPFQNEKAGEKPRLEKPAQKLLLPPGCRLGEKRARTSQFSLKSNQAFLWGARDVGAKGRAYVSAFGGD
jgi:hypothetical protein